MRTQILNYKDANLMSFVLFLIYVLFQDYLAVPWMDELCFTDTAINYVNKGEWYSNVWNYTYQPLYEILMIVWLKVFGISHAIVCNFNIFLSFVIFLLLQRLLIQYGFMTKRSTCYLFIFAYWLEFYYASLITKGRIDILSLLFAIVLLSNVLQIGITKKNAFLIFVGSFLLMGTTIYNIPIISLFILSLWVFNYKNAGRKEWFLKGILTLCGFSLSFLCVCMFYYKQNLLLYYLSSFFTFRDAYDMTMITKVLSSYISVSSILLLLSVLVLTYKNIRLKGSERKTWLIVILLIPLVMVIIGRYQPYYSWMFIIPMTIYIVSLFDINSSRLRIYITVFFIALSAMLRVAYNIKMRTPQYSLRKEIKEEVDSSVNVAQNKNIYITNALLYYPMVEKGKEIYMLINDNNKLSDKVTNNKFLYFCLGDKYKEPVPTLKLPDTGLMVTLGKEELEDKLAKLKSQGYNYRIVEKNSKIQIVRFAKHHTDR